MIMIDLIDFLAISFSFASTVIAGFAIYKSTVMHKQNLTRQNYEDIKNWYEKTLHVMKELYVEHAENYANDNKHDLFKALVTLSQQIDSGRLYFPNIKTAEAKNKPLVFRGRRPLIIDMLVLYYDIFTHNKQKDPKNIEVLRSIQRAFTSEVITYLKANKTSRKIRPYTKYDKNGIINIINLEWNTFRRTLNTEDIVSAITSANNKDLSRQIKAERERIPEKEMKKLTTLKQVFEDKKEKKEKKKKSIFGFGKKDKTRKVNNTNKEEEMER